MRRRFFYFGAVTTDYFAFCNLFDGVKNFFRTVDNKRVEIVRTAKFGVSEVQLQNLVDICARQARFGLDFFKANAPIPLTNFFACEGYFDGTIVDRGRSFAVAKK